MDRDTLQDDLDLILERSRDDELPGEWDWEPPLGTVGISAAGPRETEETDTEASSDAPGSSLDGPDDDADDEAGTEADDDEDRDD